ncbi:TPA: hypothetical protein DEO28_03945 [Candidatus Dependentiae bacterium]|nr:MAG: hypothetical protein UR14_C0006G0026 [candidate division TM6 bacterium GW2011_GWE2_31_21]KKP53551.1 MAG: hypothetical protein UR43_C0004G0092 [candidate division TM6 bacterium GW2011_GWF2_33_332]HBS48208.1 hypothetical protein [Candidatus Dependentiae bacterium]HBZ73634.1 hypothetical protein [Candidatus Dependentiae bacterium]
MKFKRILLTILFMFCAFILNAEREYAIDFEMVFHDAVSEIFDGVTQYVNLAKYSKESDRQILERIFYKNEKKYIKAILQLSGLSKEFLIEIFEQAKLEEIDLVQKVLRDENLIINGSINSKPLSIDKKYEFEFFKNVCSEYGLQVGENVVPFYGTYFCNIFNFIVVVDFDINQDSISNYTNSIRHEIEHFLHKDSLASNFINKILKNLKDKQSIQDAILRISDPEVKSYLLNSLKACEKFKFLFLVSGDKLEKDITNALFDIKTDVDGIILIDMFLTLTREIRSDILSGCKKTEDCKDVFLYYVKEIAERRSKLVDVQNIFITRHPSLSKRVYYFRRLYYLKQNSPLSIVDYVQLVESLI